MTVKDNENTTTGLTDEDFLKALREKPFQRLEKNELTNALEGWVSPIEIFSKEIVRFNEGVDDKIQEVIELELGAKIDRDELIKAMNYDREQYKKGFENGYKQRNKEIVRCKDCKYSESVPEWKDFELGCMLHREYTTATDFCSQAERKEEE